MADDQRMSPPLLEGLDQAWDRLRFDLEMRETFWFTLVTGRSLEFLDGLYWKAKSWCDQHQETCVPYRPDPLIAGQLAIDIAQLAHALSPVPDPALTWLFLYDDAGPDVRPDTWEQAATRFFSAMNERRDVYRKRFHGGLVVAGSPALKHVLLIHAPDLFSIRSVVLEEPEYPDAAPTGTPASSSSIPEAVPECPAMSPPAAIPEPPVRKGFSLPGAEDELSLDALPGSAGFPAPHRTTSSGETRGIQPSAPAGKDDPEPVARKSKRAPGGLTRWLASLARQSPLAREPRVPGAEPPGTPAESHPTPASAPAEHSEMPADSTWRDISSPQGAGETHRHLVLDPGVVTRHDTDLVDREPESQRLLLALEDPERAGAVVTGAAGMGKSVLAARVLRRLPPDTLVAAKVGRVTPDAVLVEIARTLLAAAAGGTASHPDAYRRLSTVLRNPSVSWRERLELLAANLARPAGIVLLLDNFDPNQSPEGSVQDTELARFLSAGVARACRQDATMKLIVTTRRPLRLLEGAEQCLTTILVAPLDPAGTRALVERLQGIDGLSSPEKARAVSVLDGCPRALEYLDALLRGNARFPDVAARLQQQRMRLGLSGPLVPHPLKQALDQTLDLIRLDQDPASASSTP